MNERISGMYCLRCHSHFPVGDYLEGCPKCHDEGHHVNLTFQYEGHGEIKKDEKGFRRYADFLPYSEFVSLGEGNTPVTTIDSLAKELNLKKVYTKNEFQNPSGSHKDRMNPMVIARAKDLQSNTVSCDSSGNEAASLAVYAAANGLQCANFGDSAISDIWRLASQVPGAEVILSSDREYRRETALEKVADENWFYATTMFDPPIGISSFAVQGYKTAAYELFEELGEDLPEYILVPTSRGDLIYGLLEGFQDLMKENLIQALPKLVAVEPLPRLENVLNGEDYRLISPGATSLTSSIGGGTKTYQSYIALKESDGFAIDVPQDQVLNDVLKMASYGYYLEASSAIVYSSLKKAVEQKLIPENASVLLVLTSHGYKNDPKVFADIFK